MFSDVKNNSNVSFGVNYFGQIITVWLETPIKLPHQAIALEGMLVHLTR
jgi:hypothetical protein